MPSYNKKPALPLANDRGAAASTVASSDFQINIDRTGRAVQITLTAADDYSAIALFDSLIASLNKGSGINLGVTRSPEVPPAAY